MLDLTMNNHIKLNVLVDKEGVPAVASTSWDTFKNDVRDFLIDDIRERVEHEENNEHKQYLYRLLIKATNNLKVVADIESIEEIANELNHALVRKYVDINNN